MTKTIYLVRHGKGSMEGKEEERRLTPEGYVQAEQLCKVLKKLSPQITKLYSSPYVRAIETFEPFAKSIGKPITTILNLQEFKMSSGKIDNELRKKIWEDENFKFEGGESRKEGAERGLREINKIKDSIEENTAVAVMTHGTLISVMLKYSGMPEFGFDEWKYMGMPDLYKLTFDGEKVTAAHLGCEGVDVFRIEEPKKLEINKDYLREKQYKESKYLEARIAIHKFGSSNESFHSWIFRQLKINKPVRILDIGAGTGEFWKDNYAKLPSGSSIVLTDFSQGMIEKARQNLKLREDVPIIFEIADVEKLHYPDQSFDIVMAHHMIYHAENKEKAFNELKRVVKDWGFVTITTNSEDHMFNVYRLGRELDTKFPMDRIIDTFTGEIADTMLLKHFNHVEKIVSSELLKVTDMEILINYVKSGVEPRNIQLAPDFWDKYTAIVQKEMSQKGYYGIPKLSPLYVCRK